MSIHNTTSTKPCSHCVAYMNRFEIDTRIIEENEDVLSRFYAYCCGAECLMKLHPMKIECAIDCALEMGDLYNDEAHKIMYMLKTMYEEMYVRTTPAHYEILELYDDTIKSLSKVSITFGIIKKNIYHVPQKLLNDISSSIGDNTDYYYGLVCDCVDYYEKEMMTDFES